MTLLFADIGAKIMQKNYADFFMVFEKILMQHKNSYLSN